MGVDVDLIALRRDLRARRAGLDPDAVAEASIAVARHLADLHALHTAQRVGTYRAARGELDAGPVDAIVREHGGRLYLPVMRPGGELDFVAWGERTPLVANRYGIEEPDGGRTVDPRRLDVVLVPLVAFDRRGHRLGLGAGYYDRTFAFKARAEPGEGRGRGRRRPLLVGLAHAFQEVPALPPAPWDVRLDAIATPDALLVPDPA